VGGRLQNKVFSISINLNFLVIASRTANKQSKGLEFVQDTAMDTNFDLDFLPLNEVSLVETHLSTEYGTAIEGLELNY
jgi:hypothetical protein